MTPEMRAIGRAKPVVRGQRYRALGKLKRTVIVLDVDQCDWARVRNIANDHEYSICGTTLRTPTKWELLGETPST